MRWGNECLVYIRCVKQSDIKNKIHDTNETQTCHRFSGECIKQQEVSTGKEKKKPHISIETMLTYVLIALSDILP